MKDVLTLLILQKGQGLWVFDLENILLREEIPKSLVMKCLEEPWEIKSHKKKKSKIIHISDNWQQSYICKWNSQIKAPFWKKDNFQAGQENYSQLHFMVLFYFFNQLLVSTDKFKNFSIKITMQAINKMLNFKNSKTQWRSNEENAF